MNPWLVIAAAAAGLGCFIAVSEIFPAPARLSAALTRLAPADQSVLPAQPLRKLARRVQTAAPWVPIPAADLQLLGQDTDSWIATKIACGAAGLATPALLSSLLAASGVRVGWSIPMAASLVVGAAFFMAPDLVTRVNAAEKRADFKHALTSYLDLVALERGAGAGPTEALEAAAGLGGGWAFERIRAALDHARTSGAEPWAALAALAEQTGVPELADLADIAGIAGQEGAKVLDTLLARAAAMRAEALAAYRAKALSRTTTMAVPVALLAAGFFLLLIFPDIYRVFIAG